MSLTIQNISLLFRFDSCITGSGDTLPWLLNLSYGFILFLDVYVSKDEKSYLSFFKKQEDSIVYIVNNTLLFANVIGGLMLISFLIRILIIIHLTIKAALKQDALNQNNKKSETESKSNLQSQKQNESEKNEQTNFSHYRLNYYDTQSSAKLLSDSQNSFV